ncbi:hypothetical protein MSC49_41840 (plasmid) [Methylosinus sp. C49]|nr:hypothetical protein MSC49_41840 [Methylosinus sp. C49]
MGSHELVRRRAHIRSRVVKHEVFDRHEFARAPQGGAGVVEMRAKDERLANGTGTKPLVETRESVRRALEGRLQALE